MNINQAELWNDRVYSGSRESIQNVLERQKAKKYHSITEYTVRRLTIGQRIEKRDATTAQLSPAHFVRAILKVSYTR